MQCEDLLPEACLPWTCAKTSRTQRPLLRNFLPRTAACTTSASSLNLVAPGSEDNVTLIGRKSARNQNNQWIDSSTSARKY